VLRFLAVSAFFVSINLVGAVVMLAGGKIVLALMPNASEAIWPFVIVGIFAIAAALLFSKAVIVLIGKWLSRDRVRAPG
jgi:hypothetical protein